MLKQLMEDGLIPKGDIDTRSIKEVKADDVRKYTQCHFFAGIGLWTVALELAGWPLSRPVWTGSCPCQDYSAAGKGKGASGDRHLWPDWFNLISECRPPEIFGEQVASAITFGWSDAVQDDLEKEAYAFAPVVLSASSVGAFHERRRLWFVAQSFELGRREIRTRELTTSGERNSLMGDSQHDGWDRVTEPGSKRKNVSEPTEESNCTEQFKRASCADDVVNSLSDGRQAGRISNRENDRSFPNSDSELSYVADTARAIQQGNMGRARPEEREGFANFSFIDCPDGKQRPIEPGICLLADGYPHRVPILYAIGDGIVPQVAAEFIKATM